MNSSKDGLEQLSAVKRALYELKKTRAQLETLKQSKNEPVAVIGMACRFPGGADSPESFWQLLKDGVDTISEVPQNRWNVDAYYDPDLEAPGKMITRWGGFLSDFDKFDSSFFNISPREAESMDPQQRMLLEVSWEALEDASQAPDQLTGSPTSVFVGFNHSDHWFNRMAFCDMKEFDAYLATGGSPSIASGRLSYTLGLVGPSVTVETACSSSLVAIHLAIQSLRNNECSLSLAGGVNLVLRPEVTISLSKAGSLASDGRCKTFDHRANGFVRSEGCGIVVLKRLSDALKNGDRILAVVRGTACNQDGRSTGLTAPNGPSQEAVIRSALNNGGIDPGQVSFVETHGTGTILGDPMEAHALLSVYRTNNSVGQPLVLGAVKTNIGHLEAAAGIAGFIKTVLCFVHGEIPRNLHYEKLNPNITDEKENMLIPVENMPWCSDKGIRLAGLSSFGFSGTNVHMVLGEAPTSEKKPIENDRPLHILTLSAKSESALQQLADKYGKHLSNNSVPSVADFCYTANTGRSHFPIRRSFVVNSVEKSRNFFADVVKGKKRDGLFSGDLRDSENCEIAFLFSGQGSQYVGMGRQLFETQPTFRQTLEHCDQLLRSFMDLPLLSVIYPKADKEPVLNDTAYTQPALFALEYALWELWRSWGIEPSVVMGHSLGEYVAACAAGVFSLEDGLKLIAERGRLMNQLPRDGAMAAIFAAHSEVEGLLSRYNGQVSIAAINGPKSFVLSGKSESIQAILSRLEDRGIVSRPLSVSHAFHSALMDPILDEFEKIVSTVQFHTPSIEMISNVTGKTINDKITRSDYWRHHLRHTIQFDAGMRQLYHLGCRCFVEIGPNPVLLGMGRRCLTDNDCAWLPSIMNGENDWQRILESLAELYVRGFKVDWNGFDQDYSRQRLRIPTYAFQRERYSQDLPMERKEVTTSQTSPLSWNAIVASGKAQSDQGPLDLDIGTYPRKWEVLHRLTLSYLIHSFKESGIFIQPGQEFTVDTIISEAAFSPNYRRLIYQWLQRLEREGFLIKSDGKFICPQPLPSVDLESCWQETRETLSDLPILCEYLENCGRKLIGILKGEENPLATLFPAGSFRIADFLYHEWPLIRYFTNILRTVFKTIVNYVPSERSLRVLEIGAGTGGTTASLLPLVSDRKLLYWFTDVSELFLSRAQEKFRVYSFLNYDLLDIETDPQKQGYPLHSFDIIVAANVLHATQDLDVTIQKVSSLLSPGGYLLLMEATNYVSWLDISYGLYEGFHLYKDLWRQDNAFIPVASWKKLLAGHGFKDIAVFPEEGTKAETLVHHVIVARTDQAAESVGNWDMVQSESEKLEVARKTDQLEGSYQHEFLLQLKEALPIQRQDLLVDYVKKHLMDVLRMDVSRPPRRRSRLMELGVDSLVALEFSKRLERGLYLPSGTLPATLIFDYPTIEAVSNYLEDRVTTKGETKKEDQPEKATQSQENWVSSEDLQNLSEQEVEVLLMEKLKKL